MAKFYYNGADVISASFEELARLTQEDTLQILRPAAELLMEKQRQKLRTTFTQRTGALYSSIQAMEKTGDSGASIVIYFKGKHPKSSTGRRKKKGRLSGHYSGSNSEVAYILENGSQRIDARYWIQTANEESEEEVNAAMEDAWDRYLSGRNL